MVAAHEPVPLRLGVGLDAEAELRRHGADVLPEVRFVEPQDHQLLEREQRQEHVGVDVGHDVRARDRGVRGKVPRPEQSLLLAGDGDERNRARRLRPRFVQPCRNFKQGGDARGVVHRAVVHAVSVDRRIGQPEMIEMRRENDELVSPLRIGAAQHGGDVLRLDLPVFDPRCRFDARGECEVRHRPAAVDQGEHLGEGMSGAGKQLLRVRGIHRHRQLLAAGIVQRRIGKRHLRMQARERRSRPRNVHALRIGDADGPDRSGRLVRFPPLPRRPEVRLQRTGKRCRRRRDEDDHRALHRQAGEIINLTFRNPQAVPGEHERGLQRGSRLRADVEVRVLAERQRLGPAIADERQARLRFDDAAGLEAHGLDVAGGAGRLEPGFLEH